MLGLLFVASPVVQANPKEKANKTLEYTLTKYIEATTHGVTDDFEQFIDESFKIGITRARKAKAFNKKQFIKDLKQSENIQLNCESTFSIIERTEHCALARIEMKYPTFTKVNYLNMCNTIDGWKITDISYIYPEKLQPNPNS